MQLILLVLSSYCFVSLLKRNAIIYHVLELIRPMFWFTVFRKASTKAGERLQNITSTYGISESSSEMLPCLVRNECKEDGTICVTFEHMYRSIISGDQCTTAERVLGV